MQLVLFCGLQGSGKSTFYHENFASTHLRLNMDIIRTRKREAALLKSCLNIGQRFVVDNVNPAQIDRERYLAPALENRFDCVAYYFDVSFEICLERNNSRTGKSKIPEVGLKSMAKLLTVPKLDEGFSVIHFVNADGTIQDTRN